MPAAFDSSTGGAPDRRAAGAAVPDPEGVADDAPEPGPGAEPEPGPEPDAAAWRTVIGAAYGRSLTQLAASAVDPRHIDVERALFETLFDQVPVGIAIYDTERRYVLVNKALSGYDGVPADGHVGRRLEDIVPELGQSVPLLQQHVLDTGEPVVDMLVKGSTRNAEAGRWRYWSISYARLQTEDGRVVGLTAVVVDVTERQETVERNRLARERAALLSAANSRIGTTLDIDRIAAALAEVAVPQFCDTATVFLLDATRQPGVAHSGTVATISSAALSAATPGPTLYVRTAAIRSQAGAAASGAQPQGTPPRKHSGRRTRLRGADRRLPPIEPGTQLHDCLVGGRARFLELASDAREPASAVPPPPSTTPPPPSPAPPPPSPAPPPPSPAPPPPSPAPPTHPTHPTPPTPPMPPQPQTPQPVTPTVLDEGGPAYLESTSARPAERSIVTPLKARGSLLGAVRFQRNPQRGAFTLVDLETADELAARAAVSMDNARLYLRERDTALMLQRSLLPQRFEAVEGTQVAFRYRPGPTGAQVGGDWWDVIRLPCRRIAFVIGDVMGSGLSAAGIMSQFRTAARTLAQLDLSPALVLRELDALGHSMSESHLATCVYTVYDPVTGECVLASAGHPPPVLATAGGGVELVELSPGAPLGLGGQRFEERRFVVEPGCALALYTDGLVEGRDRDIETGIDELLGALSKSSPVGPWPQATGSAPGQADARRLEAACDAAFEPLLGPQRGDDATLLIASLGRFPEDQLASWVLTSQPTVAGRARELVRRQLLAWSAAERDHDGRPARPVPDVTDVVELLVSELVTNALRYGRGPIGLRLLRGTATVVCEVADELDAAPRLRTVQYGEEGGRGLYLVDQLSLSWGTRTTAHGKIVWFEV
ncbi:SpoIIE family protein phosphatase [Actinocrinis puniceicyclus]|uniref:protein-serine/threonine phosphatase n=1 Tax=Actinocrinis puniceicyclus TaxID=977794 RepID=A0A8J8BD47_9ACTN|nr:SpoIIE family protein phosphatase [Actinocrinis puniceicyclus]MBS2962424.1 SpoIIE family protein phosphatase [Actinocrinis puniceicyclus]